MDFILNKLLLAFILSNIYLGTEFDLPRNDLIILNNGEEIRCQVKDVSGGMVIASIGNGTRTIVRELNADAARDMVEAGIVRNTRYSGRVVYFGPEYLEIETASGGNIKIPKGKVRKIIISQEPAFDL